MTRSPKTQKHNSGREYLHRRTKKQPTHRPKVSPTHQPEVSLIAPNDVPLNEYVWEVIAGLFATGAKNMEETAAPTHTEISPRQECLHSSTKKEPSHLPKTELCISLNEPVDKLLEELFFDLEETTPTHIEIPRLSPVNTAPSPTSTPSPTPTAVETEKPRVTTIDQILSDWTPIMYAPPKMLQRMFGKDYSKNPELNQARRMELLDMFATRRL